MNKKLDFSVGDLVTAHCSCGKVVASMNVTADSMFADRYETQQLTERGYHVTVNYPGVIVKALCPCDTQNCILNLSWQTENHGKMKLLD